MILRTTLILATCVLWSTISHANDFQREALLGVWKCGPYTMVGEGFDVTAAGTSSFGKDGTYTSTSDLTVQLQSGKVVKTRDRAFGSWSFDGRVIEIHYDRTEFLWSDDPSYTVEQGQRNADAQLKKKSWTKEKVLELGERLTTIPVESMYKGAEVPVTCVRP